MAPAKLSAWAAIHNEVKASASHGNSIRTHPHVVVLPRGATATKHESSKDAKAPTDTPPSSTHLEDEKKDPSHPVSKVFIRLEPLTYAGILQSLSSKMRDFLHATAIQVFETMHER